MLLVFLFRRTQAEERNLAPVDPKDCVFDGVDGEVVFKTPGQIRGADFIVRNCEVISYSLQSLILSLFASLP